MFQNALICTDFQDGLHRLVRFVPQLAAAGIRKLVFFHSVPLKDDRGIPKVNERAIEAAREKLSVAKENVPEGVSVEIVIESDRVTDNILKTVEKHQCDLLVLGTQNKTLLNEKVFGSTTANLVERIHIPLLVLRPALISTYTEEELDLRCRHLLRYLLIAYDGSSSAKHLVKQIADYARERPQDSLQTCLLGWAVEHSARRAIPQSQSIEDAENDLQNIKTQLEGLDLEVLSEVREQERLQALMDMAMEYDVSAIAVTASSVPRLLEWSRPNFANVLLRRSWHPVLFFPAPQS
jgi:nucleotide-binding universal stress UspA family protein